jgi:hypothetical protein
VIAPLLLTAGATVDAPPPSIEGAVESVVEVAEPSSVQPTVTAEEEAPVVSKPAMVPQEHNAPESMARAASLVIQEAEESSGAALPRDVGGDGARILDLARVLWVDSSEVGNEAKDDEESTACNTLKGGLAWARRTFDELILPATSVCFLCTNDLSPISSTLPRAYI